MKHRVHPDFAGRINLPHATGLFTAGGGDGYQRLTAGFVTPEAAEEEKEEDEAFWRVGVVATSQLLNSTSAAR